MNKLTLTIKPNDEITLKENLHNYVDRIKGGLFNRKQLKKDSRCKDPEYIVDAHDILLFKGKVVTVTFTETRYRYHEDGTLLGAFHYMWVIDRNKNQGYFPLEFIDKSQPIKRSHKRISLKNKILICY